MKLNFLDVTLLRDCLEGSKSTIRCELEPRKYGYKIKLVDVEKENNEAEKALEN